MSNFEAPRPQNVYQHHTEVRAEDLSKPPSTLDAESIQISMSDFESISGKRRKIKYFAAICGFLTVTFIILLIILLTTVLRKNGDVETFTTMSAWTSRDPHLLCPSNFTMVNDKCWRFINKGATTENARKTCRTFFGSHLVTLKTPEENKALREFIGNYDFSWIGLECNGNTAEHCKWSDGTRLDDSSEKFFEEGYPNWFNGSCVYYSRTSGKWTSDECSIDELPFVCEVPRYDQWTTTTLGHRILAITRNTVPL